MGTMPVAARTTIDRSWVPQIRTVAEWLAVMANHGIGRISDDSVRSLP
jgi:hypothetical protein